MITLEQVEKLVEKTGAGYEDAKAALEAAGGDMLDAVIALEHQRKLPAPPNGGAYSSNAAEDTQKNDGKENRRPDGHEHTFADNMGRLFRWCGKWIAKGNANYLDIEKRGERIITLPVTALVLLLVFLFWITIPALIISLFCGCRLSFRGAELGNEKVNDFMNKVADTAEHVKQDVESGFEKK